MTEKINSFCASSTEELFANHQWWLNLYSLDEEGNQEDIHQVMFSSLRTLRDFINFIQNTQTPVSEENTIFVGAYGPILKTEEN